MSMCFKFQLFLWYGAVTARVPGRGGRRRGPPFRGPPTPPHTPATHTPPVYSSCSKCTNDVQLNVVYVIVFWYVRKRTDDPPFPIYVLFFLFFLFFVYNFLMVFYFLHLFLYRATTTIMPRGGGRRRMGPSSGSHMGLSGAPRGPFRGPPPPSHTRVIYRIVLNFHKQPTISLFPSMPNF